MKSSLSVPIIAAKLESAVLGRASAVSAFTGRADEELVFADFEGAGLAEYLEEMIEENVRLPIPIAGDFGLCTHGEGGAFFPLGTTVDSYRVKGLDGNGGDAHSAVAVIGLTCWTRSSPNQGFSQQGQGPA